MAVVEVLAAFLLWRDSRYVSDYPESMPFNRRLWLAGKPRHRAAMARHLVNEKVLTAWAAMQ
jgi:hypothetical protein